MSWKLDIPNTFVPPERFSSLPNKLLVGAGPANCSPRVIAALGNRTTGAVCPELLEMMSDSKKIMQYVFQTNNDLTFGLQTSGTGGLEAAINNLVDPGEKVIIAVSGCWGERLVEKAKNRKADVIRLESPLGEIFSLRELGEEIIKHKPVLIFLTHGESSGGVVQPLVGLSEICKKYNCLLAVDAVVTLGAVPLFVDRWGIDVAVSATQKAIGAPPGLSLLTFSPKAVERIKSIKNPPPFYYDVLKSSQMWGCLGLPKSYHITYNSHMIAALREALLEIVEDGLETRWQRHKDCFERFWTGAGKLGITHLVTKPENQLWSVSPFCLPKNVKWLNFMSYLHDKHYISMGYGIGPSAGNLRVGFMGYNARPEVVDYVLDKFAEAIEHCKEK